jgi:phosphoglycolate phosphatase-like HAD superfamily hydrolase
MKKLILFDLDGVLIDSRLNMEYAWKAVQKTTGIDTCFDDYFKLIGRPFFDILNILGLSDRYSVVSSIFSAASEEKINLISFYPDVLETLIYLHNNNFKISVVTSKDHVRTKKILSRLPFMLDDIQTPSDIYRGKPAPDHILASISTTRIDPKDAIYIGDMDVDFEAAKRAGIDYLHADWGYQKASEDGINVLKSMKDLIWCL